MPNFSKNNKNKQNKNKNHKNRAPQKKKGRRRRQVRRPRGASSNFSKMLAMVRDPCNAPLQNGIHGDISGLMARFHKNYTVKGSTGKLPTAGYILWAPDLTPGDEYNLYIALSAASSSTFTGNFTAPYTAYAPGTFHLKDPCNVFQESATPAAIRHVSSCIKLRDIGKIVDVQGEICHLTNLPLEVLENVNTSMPSVDSMFDLGEGIRRLDKGEVQLKIPASKNARFFDGTVFTYDGNNAKPTAEAVSAGATLHGIAWRGVDPEKVSLAVDVTKNIEWKPEALAGMTQVHHTSEGEGSYIDRIIKKIQDIDGSSWQWMSDTAYRLGGVYASYNGNYLY